MKAGRELDALIAEKVMGMNVQHGRAWVQEKNSIRETILPHYSTSISAAWEVVEKLLILGFSVDTKAMPVGRKWRVPPYGPGQYHFEAQEINQFQCIVTKRLDGTDDDESWIVVCDPVAATAPLAICLAALKAVGVNPE